MSVTLADFKKRFDPNWKTLLVGWRGIGPHRRLVTTQEIQEFAMEHLKNISKPNCDMMELVSIPEKDPEQIEMHLASLAGRETVALKKEERRWVVCLLEEKLRELPSDPLYGLLALTEFWSDMDFPDYSPHRVQGRGNDVSPRDYYTAENYRGALDQHRQWISKETIVLK